MRSLTFVVGTGRCGSGVLSRIVNAHPEVLSLNELLTSIRSLPPDRPVDGAEFWSTLASPCHVFDSMIRSEIAMPEFLYPNLPETRFHVDQGGIPTLCMMVLPHLDEAPDIAFDELAAQVPRWPRRPARDHYMALFGVLAARYGRAVVVERSGYSLDAVPWLRSCFPQARFVHIHRHGPDCALSMSRHTGFRLLATVRQAFANYPPLTDVVAWLLSCLPAGHHAVPLQARSTDASRYTSFEVLTLIREATEAMGYDSVDKLPPMHARHIPRDIAPLLNARYDGATMLDRELALPVYGRFWSDVVVRGMRNLSQVEHDKRTHLAFEDLLDDPDQRLIELAAFIDVEPTPAWLEAAHGILDPTHRGASLQLSSTDLSALQASCESGRQAIAAQAARPQANCHATATD